MRKGVLTFFCGKMGAGKTTKPREIAQRTAEQPERAATDTIEMFEAVTKYFVAPASNEGFNTTVISENT